MTLLSTRTGSVLATGQGHDLVSGHLHGGAPPQAPHDLLPAGFALGRSRLEDADRRPVKLEVHLGARQQPGLLPDCNRNRDLALRRDPHGSSKALTVESKTRSPNVNGGRTPCGGPA